MNDEFMVSQASEVFLNGSFGYPDLNQRDLPSSGPNYPLATPMVRAKVTLTAQLTYIGAIFNGDPAGPGEATGPGEEDPQLRDASGTAFRLQDPPLIVNELWYRVGEEKPSASLPGIYKIGAWVHSGSFGLSKDNYTGLPLPFTIPAPLYHGDFAVYALADQMVWRKPGTKDEGVTLFGLIMGAPEDRNAEDLYAEGGLNWKGMIESRPQDVFGVAFAYAHTSDAFRSLGEESIALTGSGKLYANNETIIEATYLYQAAPWWTLQPDIQYVFNPGASLPPDSPGVTTFLKNALVIGVRTKIDF
jgi:porin